MKLRGLITNSYILVSVSDLYIPRIGLPIWLQQNRTGNENMETERQNIIKHQPNIIQCQSTKFNKKPSPSLTEYVVKPDVSQQWQT